MKSENNKNNSMKEVDNEEVEHPSDVIGGFGPMQRNILFFLIIIYIVAPLNNNHIVFTAPVADFYCVDIDPLTNKQVNLTNSCTVGNYTDAPVCTKFDHDRTFHKRTLVNTFDLVCDKAWYPSFSQSLHQLGFGVSGILFGVISDKYGRFFCAKLAITLEIIVGFGQAFSPNIYVYFVTRFLVGVAAYSRFLNGYVLVAEWVGPKERGKLSAVYDAGWTIGALLLPWAYYYLPDYKAMQLIVTITEIFLFIAYIFGVKESPRWQMTNEKWTEAESTLTQAAKQKGLYSDEEIRVRIQKLKEFTIKEQEELKKNKLDKSTIFDVLRDPKLRKTSLILFYSFFSFALVGYGSFMNIGNLGGSLHFNVFLHAVSGGVLSNVFLYYFISRVNRIKLMQIGILLKALFLAGLFACSFHDMMIPGRIVFHNLSGVVSWLSYGTLYVYITEFFPTQMRQTAIGVCCLFARIGSMAAPFIKELTLATHLAVPFAFFIFLSLMNAALWVFLPNTTDIELPDTILQSKKVQEGVDLIRSRRTSRVASIQQEGVEFNSRNSA